MSLRNKIIQVESPLKGVQYPLTRCETQNQIEKQKVKFLQDF